MLRFMKPAEVSPLCRPKERYVLTFVLALLAAGALFIPYMIQGQGYFLFYGDFNVQQIPFYQHAHQMVREGCFAWDFGTDLGANFMGSYSFYLLGSPFFWLTLLFPNWLVPYLMGPLLILKFACAALTSYAFITRFVRNKNFAMLGGILYAFSGYSVYNIFFNHFHEAIIYFPLLLLTLEWFMCRERFAPFIFVVALCSISNYYFFFGMVLFTVIYFVIRVLSGEWDMFGRWDCFKRDLARFGLVVLAAVLGVLISAVMLLPSALAIAGNTRLDSYLTGWGGLVYERSQIYSYIFQCFFFPPDLPARPIFFPGADVKWSSMAGWMPLFSMTGVIAYMAAHRKSWQKKLLVVCGVIAFIPILNSAFSLFNYNYYARWFYMPILIMALMTAKGLEDETVNWFKGWRWTFGITLVIFLAIGFFPQGQYADGSFSGFGLYTADDAGIYKQRFFITSTIALAGLVILFLLLWLRKRFKREFTFTAIAITLILSVIYSSYFVGEGKGISSFDGEIIGLLNNNPVVLKDAAGELRPTHEIDDLRIDVYDPDSALDNTGMYMGISSMHAFHSIVPGSVMEFYDYIGVGRSVATRTSTDYYALRSLLSVKYVVDRVGDAKDFENEYFNTQMPGYSAYLAQDEVGVGLREKSVQNGYYIYQNDYFIPYGFTYDHYLTREYLDTFEKEERAEIMLKGILLDEEQIAKYGHLLSDLSQTEVDYEQNLTYEFYYQNCLDRAMSACSDFTTTKNGFTATATLHKDNLVFFSIPYDEGWHATVDGAPVPVEKVNIGFMAVPVKGDGAAHTICFTYTTPGLGLGGLVSGGALVATALFLTAIAWLRRKRPDWIAPLPCNDGRVLVSEESCIVSHDDVSKMAETQLTESTYDESNVAYFDQVPPAAEEETE